jgi:Na+-transporting methylmalonyl-CoA/oxaloacetate decarboxylase gamma subunit
MFIPRYWIGTLFVLMVMTIDIGLYLLVPAFSFFFPILFLIVINIVLISQILRWTARAPIQPPKSRRNVEKLLRELDDDDLDLLRTRLTREAQYDDYDTMAELVQSGKRKNEVR